MIEGAVNSAYEPIITLTLQGPSGQTREIENERLIIFFSAFHPHPGGLVAERVGETYEPVSVWSVGESPPS